MELVRNRTYKMDDYTPYIGKLGNEKLAPLPNAETIDPMTFLNNLASGGHGMTPTWGYTLLPDGSRNQWTMLFLNGDGSGYAVTYGGQRVVDGKFYQTPFVRTFAICRHEKVAGPNANPNRGWHPGHCRLCGLDMSYDSGD